jgi:hypothetical protein
VVPDTRDWNHYLALIGAPLGGTGGGTPLVGGEITIAPLFTSANEPVVTGCGASGTSTCPAQPANFVYLRTSPSATAPLIHDTVLHPTATAGTTGAADWTDKAVAGQSFIVAAQQGAWTAIWYQGQKAWFYNPPARTRWPTEMPDRPWSSPRQVPPPSRYTAGRTPRPRRTRRSCRACRSRPASSSHR